MRRELLLQILAEARAGALRPDDVRLAGVELSLEPVAGRVHVLRGGGANVGVLPSPDGCLLVDDAFAPLVPRLRAALRPLPGGGRVRLVVNTHAHADHCHGNAALGEATVIAHARARARMEGGGAAPPGASGPAVTFQDRLALHLGGEEVRVLHLGPGHTDGDAVVHFVDSGVVQLGDLYVTYGLPFVDRRAGGSVAGTARALRRALADLPDEVRVIPGHGPVCGRAQALALAAVLEDCLGRVGEARRRGWTEEEMAGREVLGEHAALGSPFVTARAFLATLCEEAAARTG